MEKEEELIATCRALRKNDPHHTELNLDEYGALVDWKQQARKVARALEGNTRVEDLALSKHLCADSALQLSHFLKKSRSLRSLTMVGKGEETEEVDRGNENLKTSIVIESISRSSSLVKLSLGNVVFGEPCPLENFLSSNRTLLDFSYFQDFSTMTYGTAQAIGRGLAQNKSLVKLQWHAPYGLDFMEEVLFGLLDHKKLTNLELALSLTKSSSQALRSLLHCNEILERFELTLNGNNEEFPVSVLSGLANNTNLKEVVIHSQYSKNDTTLAAAWTDMLRRNTSIKILDLTDDDWEGDSDFNLSSAIAKGLTNNFALEMIRLPRQEGNSPEAPENQFNGPVWQQMLKKNHSLETLSFANCAISVEGFECLARGLSCNGSLETLDLSYTNISDTSVIALVDGLRINKTLKSLNLSHNRALSQSGRDAIEELMGHNVLKELLLANTSNSVGASILNSGLSENRSLEKLNLAGTFVASESPEIFRALCVCLRGNTALRYLNVSDNSVHWNNVYVKALKLDLMALETLKMDLNTLTSCGIAALAKSLHGPSTLKVLRLRQCQLDDTGLLKLGEVLTTNDALEVLDVSYNNFTNNGASQFFDLLPQMKGLKAIYGLTNGLVADTLTEAVGLALVNGLRKNSTLQKIFDCDLNARSVASNFSPDVAREINYYLGLNRRGRMLLRLSGILNLGADSGLGCSPRSLVHETRDSFSTLCRTSQK
jgi:Ran GTPase-activating protein (RanGAP) involved in mRNA processing and transport